MRRVVVLAFATVGLVVPSAAPAFHHGAMPAGACAESEMAGANPTAREAILERNPVKNPGRAGPFPPFGTPGEGRGQGAEHCANAEE